MAFLIFERRFKEGTWVIVPTGEHFKLGGYGLVYQAWQKRGRPTDQGWSVGADELIRHHTNGLHSLETRRLVIDFDPNADWRIEGRGQPLKMDKFNKTKKTGGT